MKKLLSIILLLVMVAVVSGCSTREVVRRRPVDARYTPAYEEIVTTTEYKVNPLGRETFQLMPNVHTEHHPESYEVAYEVTYSDGTSDVVWQQVSFAQYKAACEELGKPAEEADT